MGKEVYGIRKLCAFKAVSNEKFISTEQRREKKERGIIIIKFSERTFAFHK